MESYQSVKEKFGIHLRTLRTEKKLSLRQLALKADLNHVKIGLIESGATDLQLTTIFKLAKGLEIEPKLLLDFKL
ncbi:helix-turn-helix domain-containing protein [Mucilaginibacter lutimaris]|uniref:Helix-turn-helix domain-containing protein n=1 Tax=Mucilaginibacter lutimaris TaxID=931629 RepID=A0ABW2ZE89_9SPHI